MNADLAIVPELRKSNLSKVGANQHSIWVTNNNEAKSPKGLGVLAFGNTRIWLLKHNADHEIFLPVKVRLNGFSFNLLAVWNFFTSCKQGPYRAHPGVEEAALEQHKNILIEPSMIAEDFNTGPTLKNPANYARIAGDLKQSKFTNVFEARHLRQPGATDFSTFRHSLGAYHILDHIFLSPSLNDRLESCERIASKKSLNQITLRC